MAGFRIPELPQLSAGTLAPADLMLVFDESEGLTKALPVGPTMAGVVASPIGPQGYVFTSNGVTGEWRTSGALSVTAQRMEFTATEGQTNFALAAPYVVDYLGVYLNGVRLANNDFTANDGHNVIIAAPCKAGDIVLLEGFLGSDTGSGDDFLRADLIETTGAGLVGFDPALIYPVNTVGKALAEGYVKKPGDTMTGKLTIRSIGDLLALETTSPRGTGGSFMEWRDPSGRKGGAGYPNLTDDTLFVTNDMNAGIVLRTNGAEAMRINEVGRVGIGTTSPSAKLTVTDAAAPQLRIETTVPRGGGLSVLAFNDPSGQKGFVGYGAANDALLLSNQLNDIISFQTNGDIERMRITATGAVGIGTGTPQARFHVDDGFAIFRRYGDVSAIVTETAAGTKAAPVASPANYAAGFYIGRGYDGAAYRDVGHIAFYTSAVPTPTSSPGFITFNTTTPGSIFGTEKMRLTDNGFLGIGLFNPQSMLHVNGTITAAGDLGCGQVYTGRGVLDGAGCYVEVGQHRAGSGVALIDLHTTEASDYEARIIRAAGANGNFELGQTGSGLFNLSHNGTGAMGFYTGGGNLRMSISAAGPATIHNSLLIIDDTFRLWKNGSDYPSIDFEGVNTTFRYNRGADFFEFLINSNFALQVSASATYAPSFIATSLVTAKVVGGGGISLEGADANSTGYLAFKRPDGGRTGYLGLAPVSNHNISYINEVGGVHVFNMHVVPSPADVLWCGMPGNAWYGLTSITPLNVVSDEREKDWLGPPGAAAIAVANRVIDELGFYTWNNGIDDKVHFGVRAQAVLRIMMEEGLEDLRDIDFARDVHITDPLTFNHDIITFDTWEEEITEYAPGDPDEDGNPTPGLPPTVRPAGNRFGVRLAPLALLVAAAQHARMNALEARLEAGGL